MTQDRPLNIEELKELVKYSEKLDDEGRVDESKHVIKKLLRVMSVSANSASIRQVREILEVIKGEKQNES